MNGWLIRALMILAAGALLLRLPQLDRRPLHNDEGVNASKIETLWQEGKYQYDPHEFHGPTLYYATLPFLWLTPSRDSRLLQDSTLRLAPVFFGAGLILLLWLTAPGLGRVATLGAGVLLAISPAFVFYSRYFIHEMLLVFFGMLAMGAGWRYATTGALRWAILCGVSVGLMYATKETFVFSVAAMGMAAAIIVIPTIKSGQPLHARPWWNWKHWLIAILIGLAVAEIFFASFFTNLRGPWDAILTYKTWFNRASGASPLIYPWNFYFERLFWFHPLKSPVWTEALVGLLAILGAVAAFSKEMPGMNQRLVRFIALYTVILTAIYSLIPYKTPWCFLSFYQGMILMAGIGAAFLLELCRPLWAKILVGLVLAAGCAHLGYEAWRASYPYAADRRNPYVFSQTVPDILNLVKRVEAIAKIHAEETAAAAYVKPATPSAFVKVITTPKDPYWPLPWYLRQIPDVGWYDDLPDDPYAPIVIINSKFNALLDEKSNKKYLMVGLFELRPRVFFELYVEFELWKRYVATLPKNRDE